MKRMTCLILVLLLMMSGCASETKVAENQLSVSLPQIAVPVVTEPVQEETTAPVQIPETEEPTEVPTEVPAQTFVPYLQKVAFADQSIFDGPGYDYVFAGTVELAGTYTIVEERWDEEGNLWGKLKSGAGWIDLTDVRHREDFPMSISANFADDLLLQSGNFHHCVADTSSYAVQIAFRAHETLRDVTLYAMELTEDLERAEELFHLSTLEPDIPLVADLGFPGDMTTYSIGFTDESDAQRYFCVAISGRNGVLTVWEDTP